MGKQYKSLFEDDDYKLEKARWQSAEKRHNKTGGRFLPYQQPSSLSANQQQQQQAAQPPAPVSSSYVTDEDTIKVGLNELLRLERKAALHPSIVAPTQNFIVNEVRFVGEAQGQRELGVNLVASMRISLLSKQWTVVQLLPDKIAMSAVSLVAPSLPGGGGGSSDAGAGGGGYIGVIDGAHCLIADQPGEYAVTLEGVCPYQTARARGIVFSMPYAAKTTVEFTVLHGDVDLVVLPCMSAMLANDAGNERTRVQCDVPPTTEISVQWSEKLDEDETLQPQQVESDAAPVAGASNVEVTIEKETIVTCEQLVVHSIGEGTVQSSSEFVYTIVHGSRAAFEIAIGPVVRILSVDGKAIKRWDVATTNTAASIDGDGGDLDASSAAAANSRVLKVWLEYGIEESYSLVVTSEYEMGSTAGEVTLPRFYPLLVSREKGFVGIEARTNVELSQQKIHRMLRIGTSELPQRLYQRPQNPLLLAYKWVGHDEAHIVLTVKKHDDVPVLVTNIHSAYLTATVADGKILYSLLMVIRNTQAQFLRVSLPANSSIWSTTVGTAAVKPAMDDEQNVLLPLQGAGSSNTQQQQQVDQDLQVELVYMLPLESDMGDHGRLDIPLMPRVAVPLNHLFVSVFLPEAYRYSEFSGDLKECTGWTCTPPSKQATWGGGSLGGGRAGGGGRGRRMNRRQSQARQRVVQEEYMPLMMECDMPYSNRMPSSSSSAGVVPVRANVPVGGREFRFERLLVIDETLQVSVRYRERKKGFFAQRRVGFC